MSAALNSDSLSIVIPTFGRDRVLTDTIEALLQQSPPASEILIIDQTPTHAAETTEKLTAWNASSAIRWLRLPQPGIPGAMNFGLKAAKFPLVLYLDDDIIPASGLVAHHQLAHFALDSRTGKPLPWAVVGQVLQPWQKPAELVSTTCRTGLKADLEFPFHSTIPDDVANVMAGNLSVKRDRALEIGGFDENFFGAAYRFETEFARRLIRAGGRIRFCPEASIHHLRAERGGTRTASNHLNSADPRHGVGDYYFALRQGISLETLIYLAIRPFREVRTRFHLTHPWWIPVKLVGELRALVWAIQLSMGRHKRMKAEG